MKKHVLFVDNDRDFLDTRGEQLERKGFKLLKATSFEQAERILSDRWVHLAIIDVRLRDDNDDRDTSGLTLAKQKLYHSVPKIILTKFPSYEHVREALGPALEGLPPAVDFLAKQEGPDAMLQAVEQAFATHVRINWDLTIRFGEELSFLHLGKLVEPEIDSARIPNRAVELEDLFRRLFRDNNQITISRILAQRQKRVALEVCGYPDNQRESQFVVACGQREHIQSEEARYEAFVPQAMAERGTVKIKSEETVHFRGTAYNLVSGDLEETITLPEFYRNNSDDLVTAALGHLFDTTLAPWYETSRYYEEEKTLNELCREWLGLSAESLSQPELGHRIESICREALVTGLAEVKYLPHRLTFHLADGSSDFYPNPVPLLSEGRMVFDGPVLCGTTYRLLDGNSVLVDRQGRTWLIDFSRVSRGPLVFDFASLETEIKFNSLAISNIQARYEMERRLLGVSHLDEQAGGEDLELELQKAVHAISHIRQQASTVIGCNMDAYLVSLLYCAVDQLTKYEPEVRHTRRELIPYLHSLLSAAMLCQKLAPRPQEDLPGQAICSLWIDQPNKIVWVEGRQVALSPQEFDLLLYLYHHQGQLCSRMTIAEKVFGVTYESDMSAIERRRMEEGRLNSAMSRLRKKVEPNPSRPKYIIAIRGEGYRLELVGYSNVG